MSRKRSPYLTEDVFNQAKHLIEALSNDLSLAYIGSKVKNGANGLSASTMAYINKASSFEEYKRLRREHTPPTKQQILLERVCEEGKIEACNDFANLSQKLDDISVLLTSILAELQNTNDMWKKVIRV